MKKVLRYLSLLIPVLAALGIEVAVSLIGLAIYFQTYFYAFFIRRTIDGRDDVSLIDAIHFMPDSTEILIRTVSFLVPLIWAITFYIWYRCIRKKELTSSQRVNLRNLFTFKNIFLIALTALGLQLTVTGAMGMILPHFEKLTEQYEDLMEQMLSGNPIVVFVCIVILAPFSEELIFRGVILRKAKKIMPFFAANMIQALLFAIFHMNLVQGAYAFLVGLVLGFIVYEYNSLKASILFHLCFNALSFVLLETTRTSLLILELLIGILLTVFALISIKKIKGEMN